MAGNEICAGIYGIFCVPNKKWYIGASRNVIQRVKAHKSEMKNCPHWTCNKGLYQDVKNFGIGNFKFYILERCNPNELNTLEQKWIDYFDSIVSGYNAQKSGWNRHWRGNEIQAY